MLINDKYDCYVLDFVFVKCSEKVVGRSYRRYHVLEIKFSIIFFTMHILHLVMSFRSEFGLHWLTLQQNK